MTQIFANRDDRRVQPARDVVGYGEQPPCIRWPGDTKVAVQIVVNYEEGSEKSFAMGDQANDVMHEIPFHLEGIRDLCVESVYEYGSRAGIWRLFRIFDAAGIRVTFFGVAVALERNPAVAAKIKERRDEVAAHGYRWLNGFEMSREEEKRAIELAIESLEGTVGERPLGWYSREMSVHTRELVAEEGGFMYDSECYNDDLPYWTVAAGKDHLVVPYSLVVNDARYVLAQGYSSPSDFFEFAKATLDRLRNDGDEVARMMSIGLHPRYTGQPGRADALARFIEYGQQFDDVCFARRIDIARSFAEQVAPGDFTTPEEPQR
jgi:peptidoglycan/xylan/chitin deacetylase (PgdA/CDA1 family)